MVSAKTIGRTMGVLLLLQIVLSSTVYFGLLDAGPTGRTFLVDAAAQPTRMSLAAVLLIAGGFLPVALSTNAWPLFSQYSLRAANAYLVATGASLALLAVEAGMIMSMLTISQEYAKSGGSDARTFEIVGTVVRFARYWAHYAALLVGSGTLLLVYTTMFRFGLVPRILAGLGVACILLQMTGLIMPFFGADINFMLLAPLGICHITLSIWLVAKGFAETAVTKDETASTAPGRNHQRHSRCGY